MESTLCFGLINGLKIKEEFLNIFRFVNNPKDIVEQLRENDTWNVTFRRQCHDWEIEEMLEFWARLQELKVQIQEKDSMIWGSRGNKKFTVKDCYVEMIGRGSIIENGLGSMYGGQKYLLKWPALAGWQY